MSKWAERGLKLNSAIMVTNLPLHPPHPPASQSRQLGTSRVQVIAPVVGDPLCRVLLEAIC